MCNSLLSSFQEKEVKAGIVMAEALVQSFVGGDFDNLGHPLANIVLNRLAVFWYHLQKSFGSGEATVDSFNQ
jgi:hypothetical protein